MLLSIPQLIQQAAPTVRRLDAAQAHDEAAARGEALFIDVREADEVAADPVPGSLAIPRGVLEMALPSRCPDPDRPLYLHCASGGRATLAAEQLQRIGYRAVTAITCPPARIRALREGLAP